MDNELEIRELTEKHESNAQQLVLKGLKEHFGFIDNTLNPDLYPIQATYNQDGNIFLCGLYLGVLVCTGALLKEEEETTCRITRMSVERTCRGRGFGKATLSELEYHAARMGYTRIVLETNLDWDSAIGLYKSAGYRQDFRDGERIHMYKDLESKRTSS